VVNVLTGAYNPSGRLPLTVAYNAGQIPIYYNHPMGSGWHQGPSIGFADYVDCPHKPRYCFGHGLSYTGFAFSDLTIDKNEVAPFENVTISMKLRNTGAASGTEVVQLYLRDPSDADGPLKSLRGFQRVSVKAGQTADVTIRLTPQSFEFWDAQTNTMRVKPGRYELFYGSSSRDADLQKLTVDYQ
jgi:beta-glucosidase